MNKKVLVIGSGPIVIGQSAEFDYAGVQALLSLKEAGYKTVVLNSNPATIMTDKIIADMVYIEPITLSSVEKIFQNESIDGLLATFGGQTGLNIACELHDKGILKKYNVKLLGTDIESIKLAEDRKLFREFLIKIGEKPIESESFTNLDEALLFAEQISFPVMIRSAYTLAGSGSGIVNNKEEFIEVASLGLKLSKVGQILVERSIYGWKEIEYEIVRDSHGTCISICNMENIDPVGVHTGESIVITPSQTLDDKIYHKLRSLSIKIVSELEIKGACNVQLALSQDNKNYYVIEINPRLSRSSALASKATGYPIAKIAARIAIGQNLHEMKNVINGNSSAACEPVIDYVVVKIPKWNFEKLKVRDETIGTQMKSTGEVMSIDRSFEGALFKGLLTFYGDKIYDVICNSFKKESERELTESIKIPNAKRILQIFELINRGVDLSEISRLTAIHLWFLNKIKNITELCFKYKRSPNELTEDEIRKISRYGFPDVYGYLLHKDSKNEKSYKKIDSCSGEFECKSNYYYSSIGEKCEIEKDYSENKKEKIIVIGSGPIAIGQGIEFDYSSVHMVNAIKESGYEAIMINNNPETLSTDFDVADYLFFEPMDSSHIESIIRKFEPCSVVFQCGGQMSLNLAFNQNLREFINKSGTRILGSSIETMETCEDRFKFHKAMEEIGILYPNTLIAKNIADCKELIEIVKYPVIIRPSFVIGGRGIQIINNKDELYSYISDISNDVYPIVIDDYIDGIEVEVDGISDGENVLIPAILEHVEEAGIHSGDSMAVYPDSLSDEQRSEILRMTKSICQKLKIIGFLNIQFVIKDEKIYVIEVNPRASRTVPIITKITNTDVVKIALDVMLGKKLNKSEIIEKSPFYAVKAPVFSNAKIPQASAKLIPEMQSTGEVLGIAKEKSEAIYKAMLSVGYKFENISKIGLLFDYKIQICKEDFKSAEGLNFEFFEKSNFNFENIKNNFDIFVNLSSLDFIVQDVINLQYFSNKNTFLAYLEAFSFYKSGKSLSCASLDSYFS